MIEMKSRKQRVIRVIKKTQAQMFKNIEPGDVLLFSIGIENAGGGYRGTHASYIKVENVTKGESSYKSFNQLPTLLKNFELEVDYWWLLKNTEVMFRILTSFKSYYQDSCPLDIESFCMRICGLTFNIYTAIFICSMNIHAAICIFYI